MASEIHHDIEARADIEAANDSYSESADFFLIRSIAHSLIVITEQLERIDDALRNTVGGRP